MSENDQILVTGEVKFMEGVTEREARRIADGLAEYIGVRPEAVIAEREYQQENVGWLSVITYDEAGGQYTIHYFYDDWADDTAEEDRKKNWEQMRKYLAEHAKKIDDVTLTLYYVIDSGIHVTADHDDLIKERIEQVSKKLMGDDENE